MRGGITCDSGFFTILFLAKGKQFLGSSFFVVSVNQHHLLFIVIYLLSFLIQDKSLRVTHNLGIFGGCGLVLSIITGLFGINVDGIPGAEGTPYAFGLFSGVLFFLGITLIGLGMLYLGLKKPITEEQVQVRKLELQQLVSMFQHEAETHAKVREGSSVSRHNLPPTAADMLSDAGYVLIA